MKTKVVIRSALLWLTSALLVVISYWNIWGFGRYIALLADRHSQDEVVFQSARYESIRNELLKAGYRSGTVGFITERHARAVSVVIDRDLRSAQSTDEDGFRWSQAQFILLPWIVAHGNRSVSGSEIKSPTPFVIGDFWDGVPSGSPPGLVEIFKSEDGLKLFKRNRPE